MERREAASSGTRDWGYAPQADSVASPRPVSTLHPMWSRRLTRALLAVLTTAVLLHALVAAHYFVHIIRYGPGKGGGPNAALFVILTAVSLGFASAVFLTRRGLAKMYPGAIVPILVLACLWLAFAAMPIVRTRIF